MQHKHNRPSHIEEKPISYLDYIQFLNGKNLISILVLSATLVLMAKGTKSEDGLLLIEGIVTPIAVLISQIISFVWPKSSLPPLKPNEDEEKCDQPRPKLRTRRWRSRRDLKI
jgi:hypothetical protein